MTDPDDSENLQAETEQPWHASFQAHARSPPPKLACPYCRSSRVEQRHLGRCIAGAIGALAGAANGAARVLQAAELGLVVGSAVGGPPGGAIGVVSGSVAGAVINALVGGSAGCALGAKLGEAIDHTILKNHRCLDCGKAFSSPAKSAP